MHLDSEHTHNSVWSLQKAKECFSEVINASDTSPQFVLVRGKVAAVILSKNEYDRLLKKKKNFVEFINDSPFKGLNLVLEREIF